MPAQNLLLEKDAPFFHANVQLNSTLRDFRVQLGFQLADFLHQIIDMGCHLATSSRLASDGADYGGSRL